MINFILNGLEVRAEEGQTILEVAKFYGLEIPTLCYNEGLSVYGGCRLCLVEIGEAPRTKLVSSCTYPAEEGLVVHTDTKRVLEARKMMIELMLSVAPNSKVIQDLASKFGVKQQRFKVRNEECIVGFVYACAQNRWTEKLSAFKTGDTREKYLLLSTSALKNAVCVVGVCIFALPASCAVRDLIRILIYAMLV